MAEVQIRQNAANYVDSLRDGNDMGKFDSYDIEEAYIKGAHSRDKEIEKLRKELGLTCKSRKYYEDKYYNREGYYHDLCEKQRNPWISIKEKPKKTDTYFIRTKEGCVDMAFYCKETDEWYDGKITDGTPILYMTIPGI